MPTLIESSDNAEIEFVLSHHNIDHPISMVGDYVYIKQNFEKLYVDTIKKYYPDFKSAQTLPLIYERFNKTQRYKILKKYLASDGEPWWSELINDDGEKIFYLDECLYNKPNYDKKVFAY